ncbi:MAG: zinc-binding dehydrogenase [Armatimonadia bacterium]|nr:zinc-binding dehydrogenase [Armatimonadia bacterium]
MKTFVLTEPKSLELLDLDRPQIEDDEILCQTMYTAISPGTYLLRYLGTQPSMAEYPYIPGYLNVGRVVETGAKVLDRGYAEGDIVHVRCFNRPTTEYRHCNGSDVEFTVIPEPHIHYLTHAAQHPRHLAFAIFGHLGFAAVQQSKPGPHSTALVIGQGILGAGCTRALALAGARQIVAVDMIPRRREIAKRLGATHVEIGGPEMVDELKEKYPDGFDIVIEATGNSNVPERIFELSASGDVLLVSLYDRPAPVFFGNFKARRLIGLPQDSWWLKLMHRMMDTGLLMVDEIISDVIPATLEDMRWAYETMLQQPEDHLGILVDWTGETTERERIWD